MTPVTLVCGVDDAGALVSVVLDDDGSMVITTEHAEDETTVQRLGREAVAPEVRARVRSDEAA